MPDQKMELGIIGLGKMGGNLALQAIDKNIQVAGKARSKKPDLKEKGVKVFTDYGPFISYLKKDPKLIYLSLPAGNTVDKVLEELLPFLQRGDVIMVGVIPFIWILSKEKVGFGTKREFIFLTVAQAVV
jgi:6-phosphogluconate dehydrogenase